MSAPVLDVTRPESAQHVGGELVPMTQTLVARLSSDAIISVADLQQAVLDRQQIGDAVQRVQEFFKPFKSMAHRLHAALCDRENEILAPLRDLDHRKRELMSTFKAREEQERRERERTLAQEQKRIREAAAASEAAALEQSGQPALAAAVLDEALSAPVPVVALPDVTKRVDGLKFVRRYLWRYANNDRERALRLIPREYLVVDEKKLSALARAMKGTQTIPGVEFFSVDEPVR